MHGRQIFLICVEYRSALGLEPEMMLFSQVLQSVAWREKATVYKCKTCKQPCRKVALELFAVSFET